MSVSSTCNLHRLFNWNLCRLRLTWPSWIHSSGEHVIRHCLIVSANLIWHRLRRNFSRIVLKSWPSKMYWWLTVSQVCYKTLTASIWQLTLYSASPSSSTSIPGYARRGLSSRSYNQCVLLPKCCSEPESVRPLLLFSTARYPTTNHSHTYLFGMLEEPHGDIRDCSPGPIPSETVDRAEERIWSFCPNCSSILWFDICVNFNQRCDIALPWLADDIYKLRLCSYLDNIQPRFMIPTFSSYNSSDSHVLTFFFWLIFSIIPDYTPLIFVSIFTPTLFVTFNLWCASIASQTLFYGNQAHTHYLLPTLCAIYRITYTSIFICVFSSVFYYLFVCYMTLTGSSTLLSIHSFTQKDITYLIIGHWGFFFAL